MDHYKEVDRLDRIIRELQTSKDAHIEVIKKDAPYKKGQKIRVINKDSSFIYGFISEVRYSKQYHEDIPKFKFNYSAVKMLGNGLPSKRTLFYSNAWENIEPA